MSMTHVLRGCGVRLTALCSCRVDWNVAIASIALGWNYLFAFLCGRITVRCWIVGCLCPHDALEELIAARFVRVAKAFQSMPASTDSWKSSYVRQHGLQHEA